MTALPRSFRLSGLLGPAALAFTLVFTLAFVPAAAVAATHYVRAGATGAKTGADWTNAWTTLPATLVRGDTYYLAGGQYGSHVFRDPASGTTPITILRATAARHGSDAGWTPNLDSGPAVFTHWEITTDWYVFDGQRRDADWQRGATANYGLRVAGTGAVRLDDGGGHGANHLRFRFVDFAGGGRDTSAGDDVIYGLAGHGDLVFQDCALHDADRTIFLMRGHWQDLLVDHCYIARNASTPAIHGELMSMTDTTRVTISNNVLEDIEGSAFFAGVNGGTSAYWRVFGNVVQHTTAYIANRGRPPGHNWGVSGFVFIGNDGRYDGRAEHWQVSNNTFHRIQGLWSGVVIQAGYGNSVSNNIWFDSVRTNNSFVTTDHNWYFNTVADGDLSTTKVVCTARCDIFVNPAASDFHLAKPLPAGASLDPTMAVDLDGVNRAAHGRWDRGAYQYAGPATPTPAPAKATTRSRQAH